MLTISACQLYFLLIIIIITLNVFCVRSQRLQKVRNCFVLPIFGIIQKLNEGLSVSYFNVIESSIHEIWNDLFNSRFFIVYIKHKY